MTGKGYSKSSPTRQEANKQTIGASLIVKEMYFGLEIRIKSKFKLAILYTSP